MIEESRGPASTQAVKLQAQAREAETLKQRVEITPELVVRIDLLGACADCSMIRMTLKGGVESALKKAAPEVTAIEAGNLL